MRAVVAFVRTTLLGGVLFLVPVVLAALVVREAVQLAIGVLRPVARLAPDDTIVGIAAIELLAAAIVAALCFLAGLVAQTGIGRAFGGSVEHAVLRRIPGYIFLKTMIGSITGLETASGLSPALVWIGDCWGLGFVIERHPGGLVTVFVPSAPTPAAGTIYYLAEDRIRPLDVPISTAMGCIMRLGVGSTELIDKAAATGMEGPDVPDRTTRSS